ncbi:MAG: FtsB family cell division protein [Bacilli bacterium]
MKKSNKKSIRRIIFLLPFAIGVTFLVIQLLNLTVEYSKIKNENATIKARVKEEEAIATELESVIDKLNDPDYLKTYAKENYLYSEDGTIIIRIPKEDEED